MAVFRRRKSPPPPVSSYSEYRPFVRDDFEECCAYCLLHEEPDSSLEADGYVFLDFCAEAFSSHFYENVDGSWLPLSRSAEYTLARLRLNRKHLVRIRLLLRRIASEKGAQTVNWNLPLRDQLREFLDDSLEL